MAPAVSDPMVAVGPEEDPVRLPVTFPVRFPVMPFETTRFVVVAVPETTRFVLDAVPPVTRDPVTARFDVVALPDRRVPERERFAPLMLPAVMFPEETPRKVEVPEVAVKLKPVTVPKTSSMESVVVFAAPTSTWAVVVEGRYTFEV